MLSRHHNHINSHYAEFHADPSIFLPVTIINSPRSHRRSLHIETMLA